MSLFAQLAAVDVTKHIEKKGAFSYLSWPFAVHQLRTHSPSATWEVIRFDGLPYQETKLGYFVEVAVTVDGITLSQIHPVLDARNRPLQAPTPFDINTSIQRCLVKAIALHGLGLSIYAGEDLPNDTKDPSPPKLTKDKVLPATHTPTDGAIDALPAEDKAKAQSRFEAILDYCGDNQFENAAKFFYATADNELQIAIWEMLKPFPAMRREIRKRSPNAVLSGEYVPGEDHGEA